MRKSDIEERMRQSLQKRTDPHIEESGRGAVMLAARQEYRAASGNRRISFWQFMAGQVRFMGWRTWGAQAAALMTVYAFFYTLYRGDMGYLWGRHLPVLLCFASVFLLFPSLPMLARSRRYQMAETEQVSRFSSNRLLTARLMIISAGDFLMLVLLFLFSVVGMGGNPGVALLYLLMPFLVLGSIYMTIAVHVEMQYILRACFGAGIGTVVILLLMYYYCHGFYEHSFQKGWMAVCAVAVLWDIRQLRRADRMETAVEIWQ